MRVLFLLLLRMLLRLRMLLWRGAGRRLRMSCRLRMSLRGRPGFRLRTGLGFGPCLRLRTSRSRVIRLRSGATRRLRRSLPCLLLRSRVTLRLGYAVLRLRYMTLRLSYAVLRLHCLRVSRLPGSLRLRLSGSRLHGLGSRPLFGRYGPGLHGRSRTSLHRFARMVHRRHRIRSIRAILFYRLRPILLLDARTCLHAGPL